MTDDLEIDDASVVWSIEPAELAGRPLVVLMHGRGSHENDLTGLIPLLPPEFAYASLRAPLRFEGGGYTWFAAGAPGAPPPPVSTLPRSRFSGGSTGWRPAARSPSPGSHRAAPWPPTS